MLSGAAGGVAGRAVVGEGRAAAGEGKSKEFRIARDLRDVQLGDPVEKTGVTSPGVGQFFLKGDTAVVTPVPLSRIR